MEPHREELEPLPRAKDFMTAQVQTITPEMPLAAIIEFLEKHLVSNAPVVELQGDEKMLVGFVSERECLEFLANESFFGSLSPRRRRPPSCVGTPCACSPKPICSL